MAKNGNQDYTLIGTFVQSPLTWDIVTGAANKNTPQLASLNGRTFGISRIGSGSHIMSYLLAERENWKKQNDINIEFKSIGGLKDLVNALVEQTADAFMWESFMLRPNIDSGELRKLGSIVTPWPCFLIAARKQVVETQGEELSKMIKSFGASCATFYTEKKEACEAISRACHLSVADAETWHSKVEFSKDFKLSKSVLKLTIETLLRVGVLQQSQELTYFYNDSFTGGIAE